MADHTDPQNYSKVHGWVNERTKAGGKFKDCTHLKVSPVKLWLNTGSVIVSFIPECGQRSFEWSGLTMDDQGRRGELVQSLESGREIIACPSDCLCYESRIEKERAEAQAQKAAAAKAKRERLWALAVGPFKAVFGWFSRLPWQTQVLIILLGILAISPKWVPQLIVLIKALAQLFH